MLICHSRNLVNDLAIMKAYFCRRDIHVGQNVASTEVKRRSTSSNSENGADMVNTPPQNKPKFLKLPPIIASSSQVSTEIEAHNNKS